MTEKNNSADKNAGQGTNSAEPVSPTKFTKHAKRSVSEIAWKDVYGRQTEKELYQEMIEELERLPSFHMQLKRYIRRNLCDDLDLDSTDIKTWISVVNDSFLKTGTPRSLTGRSDGNDITVKNWLTKNNISRGSVFLLGFGLRMTVEDVTEFLTRYIGEENFRPTNPEECVYQYCFAHRLIYQEAKRLLRESDETEIEPLYLEHPDGYETESVLLAHLRYLKINDPENIWDQKARDMFLQLWKKCIPKLVYYLNDIDVPPSISEETFRKEKMGHKWTEDMVTPYSLEKVLYTGVGHTASGNIERKKGSKLERVTTGYMLTRQRFDQVAAGKVRPKRNDLITLMFVFHSQKDYHPKDAVMYGSQEAIDFQKERYVRFVRETNRILQDCGMGKLYAVNPYEALILTSMRSVSPLEFFNNIWYESTVEK